jgi:hypothetical protein
MGTERDVDPQLRYLEAEHIEGPLAQFDGADVLEADGRKIGEVIGALVHPAARRIRYLVIERKRFPRAHRYLLPLTDIRIDAERSALVLDDEDHSPLDRFDRARYAALSDDDLVTAIFANQAA